MSLILSALINLIFTLSLNVQSESLFHILAGEKGDCKYITMENKNYDGFFKGGPQSFRVGIDGFFYIADSLSKKILRFDSMGNLASTIPGTGSFNFIPTDFCLTKLSEISIFNTNKNRIEIFSLNGKMIKTIDKNQVRNKFTHIEWMEIDNNNNYYFKDKSKNAIIIFDSTGKPRGGVSTKATSFAIDENGNIFYLVKNKRSGFFIYLYSKGKKPMMLLCVGYDGYNSGEIVGIDNIGRIFITLKKYKNDKTQKLLAIDSSGMIDFEKNIKDINMKRNICVTKAGNIYYMIYDKTLEKGALRILKLR
jgi:hypothetical protein